MRTLLKALIWTEPSMRFRLLPACWGVMTASNCVISVRMDTGEAYLHTGLSNANIINLHQRCGVCIGLSVNVFSLQVPCISLCLKGLMHHTAGAAQRAMNLSALAFVPYVRLH